MILSDREIMAALERGAFRITPDPRSDPQLWSSTTVDLKLDAELIFWDPAKMRGTDTSILPPDDPDFDYESLLRNYTGRIAIPDTGHKMQPGDFFLGWTIERLQFPEKSRIAARIEGKSSLARLGIGVHVTAPTIHAGFGYRKDDANHVGLPIQLEIWNTGKLPFKLKKGMRVCQLIFEEVHGTPEKGYAGRFTDQGPLAQS